MPKYNNKWEAENYPSELDYLEAKRSGALQANRHYMDKPAGADPDQKKFRPADSPFPDVKPKPFTGSLPNEPGKKISFRLIVFIIALVAGFLPAFSNILDEITDAIKGELFNQDASTVEETATTAVDTTDKPGFHVTTALPSGFFKLSNPLYGSYNPHEGALDTLGEGLKANIALSVSDANMPLVNLTINDSTVNLLDQSAVYSSEEKSKFFAEDGSLLPNAGIDLIVTDLTKDGIDEFFFYFYNDVDYPVVEIFYNGGTGLDSITTLDYFESYTTINITDQGIIQRIDESGNLYDEIEVTPDGAYVIE